MGSYGPTVGRNKAWLGQQRPMTGETPALTLHYRGCVLNRVHIKGRGVQIPQISTHRSFGVGPADGIKLKVKQSTATKPLNH